MSTAAEIRAKTKYNENNTKQYCFRFNTKTDADIIAKLETMPSKAGYVKNLIREDIKKDGA